MKFGYLLALIGSTATLAQGAMIEECRDVWGHNEDKALCASQIGAHYWGYTHGRYGTSGCNECGTTGGCPSCPTVSGAPTLSPTPSVIPLPAPCAGHAGSWWGDPHMVTFDGVKYDCQGEGEFHVLKSLDSDFQIQGRFTKWIPPHRPTVTTGIAWNSGDEGEPTIQMTPPGKGGVGRCLPYIKLNKIDVDWDPLLNPWLVEDQNIQIGYIEKNSGRASKYMQGWIIYHHNSGLQVTVYGKWSQRSGSCYMAVKYCLPKSWPRTSERLVGLLGTPDGDKSNDWMDRETNLPVPIPTSKHDLKFETAYNYCVQWCIEKEADSLFYYNWKGRFTDYYGCEQPADTEVQKCVENPDDDINGVCGPDDFACLVDGCVGGVDEAQDYLIFADEVAKDENCGKEIYLEKFDGLNARKEWPAIAQGNLDSKFLYLVPPGVGKKVYVEKTVKVPANADLIEIEFVLLEIGQWEGDSYANNYDAFYLHVGNTKMNLKRIDRANIKGNPDEYFQEFTNGIFWERRRLTDHLQNFEMPFSKGMDQLHKVTVKISPAYYENTGDITFGFEVDVDGPFLDEAAGIDDLRITAYAATCDIFPSDFDNGVQQENACAEQVVFESFENRRSHQWGKMATMEGTKFLVLDGGSKKVDIQDIEVPAKTEAVILEFFVYPLADWAAECGDDLCPNSKLLLTVHNQEIVRLDTPDKATDTAVSNDHGKHEGVEWYRIKMGEIVKMEVHIPKTMFPSGVLVVGLSFEKDYEDRKLRLGLGIDEVRAIAFSNDPDCPTRTDESRRSLIEMIERNQRHLTTAEADDCDCVCPALPGETPAAGSSAAPVVMNLYHNHDESNCDPEAPVLGTVTMTQTLDGRVQFDYSVDPAFELQDISIYVGEERLPWDINGDFLPPSEFPFTVDASGTTATHIVDPHVCDYYAAVYARICGEFPTLSPTTSPTSAPEPTQAPGSPTAAPTNDCEAALPAGLSFGSYSGNPQCHSGGSDAPLGFDYGFKMNGCQPGTFDLATVLDSASGGGEIKGSCSAAGSITVTVACNPDKSATISWTGLGANVMAVKVKGSNQGTLYAPNNGGNYVAGYNGGGNIADISHIEFCLNCVGPDCAGSPTASPTVTPESPTKAPTDAPESPTKAPTEAPESPTKAPTDHPVPTPSPTNTPPGSYGDPHIKVWSGETFDFHGACDLVLLDNPSFRDGLGMTIHIRTKIVTWWSFIETAAIRVGNETIEVMGGEVENRKYLVNGVVGDKEDRQFTFSPANLRVLIKQINYKQFRVRVDLLNGDAVGFEVYKNFVRVNIQLNDPKWKKFYGSVGLMGTYPTGARIGRDGKTVFTDMNAFGQEWQVLESEPKLFQTIDGPQHPTKCVMPNAITSEEKRRRLGESAISREEAELACARVFEGDRSACIFDVLATNDKDMAGSY